MSGGSKKSTCHTDKVLFDNESVALVAAGTHDLHGLCDDLKIPLCLTKHQWRYKQAGDELQKHCDGVKM